MDGITPVGAMIQPVDASKGINTLSGIIGLQQQKQALQTGQYQQATAQAESQQAQQKNNELQKAQAIAINGAKSGMYDDGEGGLDRQKIANDILKVAPTYGQPIMSSLLSQANEVVQNKRAHQALSQERQGQMGATFGSLATKKDLSNSDFVDALNTLTDENKDPQFKRMAMSMLTHLPPNASPQQLQEVARRWSIAATNPEGATAQTNPAVTTIQGPTGLQPVQTNPQAPGGIAPIGKPLQQGVAPGSNVVTDSFGKQYILDPQTNTLKPVGEGRPGPGGTSGFQQPVADQPAVMAELREARAATSQGGVTRNVNQHLLDLSSETKTGPGTQTVQGLAAALGMPSGTRYQEISAYLDRQAALQAQVMGVPNTNAGLAAAERATGTTEYTPQALREKVKFFDALNSGAMAYRQGLDKAVGTGATPDLTKYQAFRSAWTQNFDPDVYRAEDAMRRGDKEELGAMKKRLGANGMKTLAVKSANLRQLENGQLPQ